MRESGVPLQMINGRNDLVAGVCWVKKLAKQLKCPLILTGMAHTGPSSAHTASVLSRAMLCMSQEPMEQVPPGQCQQALLCSTALSWEEFQTCHGISVGLEVPEQLSKGWCKR